MKEWNQSEIIHFLCLVIIYEFGLFYSRYLFSYNHGLFLVIRRLKGLKRIMALEFLFQLGVKQPEYLKTFDGKYVHTIHFKMNLGFKILYITKVEFFASQIVASCPRHLKRGT